MRQTLKLLPLLAAVFIFGGCDRLSDKDRMDMIAKCDSEARKKISELTRVSQTIRTTTLVSTHYSFSVNKCYALEKKEVVSDVFDVHNTWWTLFDGLTKQEIVKTGKSKILPKGYAVGEGLGSSATATDGEEMINRLMSSP
jgi:hypothetical protein